MAGSLKDQLLKAGLVSTKQVKQASHEQRKSSKGAYPKAKADEAARAEAQAATAKMERDRELNRKRQEEAERKAQFAQIKQLVEANRLADADGDIPYNFTDGTKVKRIHVTKEAHAQLMRGALAIARQGGRYHLVRPDVAEKIRERNAASVITINAVAESPAADDPYAAYQVPDDLIW